jgi:Fe-S cluster assembly protein SufD
MTDVLETISSSTRGDAPFVTALRPRLKTAAAGPTWLADLRREAAAWFSAHGLPHPKEEAWRFTSLRPLSRLAPLLVPARLSTAALPAGVTLLKLDGAEGRLGQLASTHHAFAALNTALFEDALVIEVAPGSVVEAPLEIAHVARGGARATLSLPRVLVIAGEASQLQLVERYGAEDGTSLTAGVTEVFVGENAGVEHVRVLDGAPDAYNISLTAVRQARDSRYTSRVATFGGTLSRLDLRVLMDGEGAECTLDGLYLAGDDEHVDHQTFIDHARAHCTSHEKYKGVLQGSGRAVFDGGVTVRHGAQQTDAHQENRNLVLSDRAKVNTKPSLVIDADDVKCSHGATVGQLDPAALFYLRARGIGEAEARALLAFAFAREMTERITPPGLRRELVEAVLARMPEGRLLAAEDDV